MLFSPVKYGIHAIDSKNLTELGATTTDENGEFTISLIEPLPNDAIFYISVLDPVTNEIVVQSVVFPEDTDKHINVTPHSHIIANLFLIRMLTI